MSGRKDNFTSFSKLIANQTKTLRRCLKCSKEFESIGIAHRICFGCNEKNKRFPRRVDSGGGVGNKKSRSTVREDYSN